MRLERANITWSELRVGLLVLLAISILAAMLIYISRTDIFSTGVTFQSHLSNAKGIRKGDPVQLAGIQIGTVKSIGISGESSSTPVQVVLAVSTEAARHIHQDAIFEIHGASLTPTQHIEIHPGTDGSPLAEPGSTLQAREAAGLDNLFVQVADSMGELESLLKETTHLVAGLNQGNGTLGNLLHDSSLYTDLQRTASLTSEVLSKANRGEGTLGQMLANPDMAEDLRRALASTRVFLEHITDPQGSVGQLTQENVLYQDVRNTLAQWRAFATTLEQTASNTDKLITTLHPTIEKIDHGDGTMSRLLNDASLHDQLLATASQASDFLNTAQHGDGLLARSMQDPELAEQVSQTVQATSAIAQKLNTPGGMLDRIGTDGSLYDQLLSALAGINSVVAQIQEADGTAGTLIRDEQFPKEFRAFVQDFQALVKDIQTHPERYVHLSFF